MIFRTKSRSGQPRPARTVVGISYNTLRAIVLALGPAATVGILLFLAGSYLLEPVFWAPLYTITYIGISILVINLYREGRGLDFLAPIFPSLLILLFYSLSGGLNAVQGFISIYGDVIERETLVTYYVTCLVGQFAICAGFLLGRRTTAISADNNGSNISDGTFLAKLILLSPLILVSTLNLVTGATNVGTVKSYGEVALASRVERAENVFAAPREIFITNPPFTILLCLILVLILRTRNMLAKVVGGVVLGSFVITAILGGNRSPIVLLATLALCLYNYRVKRLGLLAIVVVFFAGYVVVNLMPVLRAAADPQEMGQIFSEVVHGDYDFMKMSNSGEFLVGQNLMRLISGIKNSEVGYTYGSSVITELLTFIPRAIYPGRPLPLSERFMTEFYAGVRESGGGYGFFYLMEGYWAFGLVGVVIFMLVYARLVQAVYEIFRARMTTNFMALWYGYMLFIMVITAVRTGLIGTLKASLMYSVPFVIIYLLPAFKSREDVARKLNAGAEGGKTSGASGA